MKEKEMHSLFFKHKFVKVTPYLRRFGHRLSGMIMPNLSIFIAWSLLSLVAGYTTGNLRLALSEVETIMIRVVLPILQAEKCSRNNVAASLLLLRQWA